MIKAYAALEPKGELKSFEYDPGDLASDEIEIDVLHCGICHSDISVIDNAWENTSYPVVPGHEVVGKVAKVGDSVSYLQTGQVVGLGWHAGFCNACNYCHSGERNLCTNSTATIIEHHGGFADRVRAKANSVVPIPEGIPLESAGPLFCGGITVFNPLIQFNIKPTDKVAVIGIGGLGHLALQFLNAWGCEVTAFTSHPDKKKQANQFGAHHILDTLDSKEIEEAAGRFDFVISTVNVKQDWNLILNTVSPKGRFHSVGVPLDPLDLNVFLLIMGQRSVSGSPVGSPATMRKMLDFAKLHQIQPLVEQFKFEDVNQAIEKVRQGTVRYRAVLSR